MVELLGVASEMAPFEYTPSEANLKWAREWLEKRNVPFPRIGIHPGSAGGKRQERKRWRIENFIEVANRLVAEGFGVVIFEGPFEGELGSVMEREVKEKCICRKRREAQQDSRVDETVGCGYFERFRFDASCLSVAGSSCGIVWSDGL